MPVATDSQTLFNAAKCYSCVGYLSEMRMLRLGLLQSIANTLNPMAATDAQSLINLTNCYSCVANASLADMLELGLLQIIANNVGSGSSGGINNFTGSGAPTTQVPANGAGTYYDYTNQILYNWNPVTAAWN